MTLLALESHRFQHHTILSKILKTELAALDTPYKKPREYFFLLELIIYKDSDVLL